MFSADDPAIASPHVSVDKFHNSHIDKFVDFEGLEIWDIDGNGISLELFSNLLILDDGFMSD